MIIPNAVPGYTFQPVGAEVLGAALFRVARSRRAADAIVGSTVMWIECVGAFSVYLPASYLADSAILSLDADTVRRLGAEGAVRLVLEAHWGMQF